MSLTFDWSPVVGLRSRPIKIARMSRPLLRCSGSFPLAPSKSIGRLVQSRESGQRGFHSFFRGSFFQVTTEFLLDDFRFFGLARTSNAGRCWRFTHHIPVSRKKLSHPAEVSEPFLYSDLCRLPRDPISFPTPLVFSLTLRGAS